MISQEFKNTLQNTKTEGLKHILTALEENKDVGEETERITEMIIFIRELISIKIKGDA